MFYTKPVTFKYLKDVYGVNLDIAKNYNESTLDITQNELGRKLNFEKFWRTIAKDFLCSFKYHENVRPFDDMVNVIKKLKDKYEIHVVTARQEIGLEVINFLIDKYIPNCITKVHNVWSLGEDNNYVSISKREYIESQNGKKIAFFDDSPKEIDELHEIINSYLFDPFNFFPNSKFKRVESWKEIETILL